MNRWIKIAGDIFYTKECDVQLSMEKWATLYLSLDISAYPKYYDEFVAMHEVRKTFDMTTISFSAIKCRIKTLDIDFGKSISMCIRCEELDTHDMSVRRDGLIDDILGEKTTFMLMQV